ncbi:20481_t:CDS:2, partial [Racocetra persica]
NNDMDLDKVPSSVTSFETNTLAENSSRASFSQHAQLREAANRHDCLAGDFPLADRGLANCTMNSLG